jgi:hypothetical protein
MRTHRAAALSRVVHIMNEIVCRRDEIGSTNEVPFVPEQELPAIVTNRYNSLLVAILIVCLTLRVEIEARAPCRSAFKEEIYSCKAAFFQIS